MRQILSAVLLFAVVSAFSPTRLAAQPRSISNDDLLAQIGVDRAGQLLVLLETMTWSTVSGFDVGPASPTSVWETPVVTLDGEPVNGSVFGLRNINAIPVDPTRWDSVTVSRLPRVVRGTFRPEPVIDIVPRRPADGLELALGGWVGNGVGDPGPHQYLDPTLANVERIGPDGHATLAYGADAWFAEAHLTGRRHGLLSEDVSPRLSSVYAGPHQTPRIYAASIALRGGFETSVGCYEAQAHRTVVDDFLFLEEIGHEVPTQLQTTAFQVSGVTESSGASLSYGASYSTTETVRRPGALLDWALDWSESRSHAFAELASGRTLFGAALTRLGGSGPGLGRVHALLPAAYASRRLQISGAVSQSAGMHVTFGDEVAPTVWTTATIIPHDAIELDVSAVGGFRLFSQGPSLWYWHAKGYDLLDRAGVEVMHFEPSARSRFATVSIRGAAVLGEGTTVSGAILASMADDLNVPDVERRAISLHGNIHGGTWGATGSIESRLHETLLQRIGYTYAVPFGAPEFRRMKARQPQHVLSGISVFEPNDRFSLAAVLRIESETRWYAYSAREQLFYTGEHREQDLPSHLPTRVGLDFSVSKDFWGPHLNAGLTVRNVLGHRLRYHPAGVEYGTSLMVRIVLQSPAGA